jgi:hypothetical protein
MDYNGVRIENKNWRNPEFHEIPKEKQNFSNKTKFDGKLKTYEKRKDPNTFKYSMLRNLFGIS